ncbi:hypothetical protein B1C78_16795 [Thioalkalivibrio denitrificans]|uniref:Uncharacterized protein n=1 Tax=Thioalkalivibrio denitrificans TaxID=108003 RepID=A0A1V3N7Z7_9GAMM|nr:hypothetical protein [Thioalkalivibrio denitrificans]OOG21018.1 hypothetical protein B1C78_16795 [Thioalkalivibrio denitrificans]
MIASPAHPAHLVIGLVVWSVWFVVLYGGLSVACAVAPPAPSTGALTWINGVLLLLTLLVTGALLVQARHCLTAVRRSHDRPASGLMRFLPAVSGALYLASAVATLAVGLPVIMLPPCL